MFSPGHKLTIHYPKSNHVTSTINYRQRRIEFKRVRDLVREPLTAEEFLRRPYLRRSRYLATAIDHDLGSVRRFYLGISKEFAAPSVLQIGAFCDGMLVRFLDRPFAPAIAEHRLIAETIPLWQDDLHDGETLGIFAPDLAVVA